MSATPQQYPQKVHPCCSAEVHPSCSWPRGWNPSAWQPWQKTEGQLTALLFSWLQPEGLALRQWWRKIQVDNWTKGYKYMWIVVTLLLASLVSHFWFTWNAVLICAFWTHERLAAGLGWTSQGCWILCWQAPFSLGLWQPKKFQRVHTTQNNQECLQFKTRNTKVVKCRGSGFVIDISLPLHKSSEF